MIEMNSNFYIGLLIGSLIASVIWFILYYKDLKYQQAYRVATQMFNDAELELTTRCYEEYGQSVFLCLLDEKINNKLLPIDTEQYIIEPYNQNDWRVKLKSHGIYIYPNFAGLTEILSWHDLLNQNNGILPTSTFFKGKMFKHLPTAS